MRLPIPIALLSLTLAVAATSGQTPAAFETSVEIVRLGVTVTRGGNQFVTGLEASDFRIYEDDVPQEVTIFSQQSAPLTLVLLLDTSMSMTDRLPQVQEAASRFVRVLDAKDVVQVAEFKERITVLQDYTSNRGALEAAIHRTRAVGATALYNALYGAIRTLRQRRSSDEIRRQAIVVLSDGDDDASVVSEDQVLDFACRSEVAIYGIGLGPKTQDRSAPTPALTLLTSLTRETGGTLLLPTAVKELEGVYEDIAAELRTQYSLGYISGNARHDGKWRRISVRIPTRKGLQVRHRRGYYATSRTEKAGRDAPDLRPGPKTAHGDREVANAESPAVHSAGPKAAPADRMPARAGSEEGRAALSPGAGESSEPQEWMDIRDGVLEMKLAHKEPKGADYGLLKVDPVSRRVTWTAEPGLEGCARPFERGFEAIESISMSKHVGFLMEFRSGRGEAMALLPAPHGSWFAAEGVRQSDRPKELLVETRTAVSSLLEALGRAPSAAQVTLHAFYGTPVSVELADLFQFPGEYEGKAVRVKGDFQIVSRDQNQYALHPSSQTVVASDDLDYTISLIPTGGSALELAPVEELATLVSSQAERWEGEEIEVAGVFRRRRVSAGRPGQGRTFKVEFWDVTGSRPPAPLASVIGRPATLEELTTSGGKLDDVVVRIIGRFRGQNLYGDLPDASRWKSSDWVLKEGPHAVWVTGKPPAGPGWSLNPRSAKDTINWLQVVGRPRTRRGFTYVRAMDVVPTRAPSPDVMPEPAHTQIRTYGPPVIAFALPETGETIAPETRFVIQFSNPMDPASIQGRVQLQYALPRPGDSGFEWLRVSYSDHTRHIVIDPGGPLEPGRSVQCRLLPGIVDANNRPLIPRPGRESGEAVEVLQFRVGE